MGRQKSKSCTYRVSLLDDYNKKSKDELVEEVVDSEEKSPGWFWYACSVAAAVGVGVIFVCSSVV